MENQILNLGVLLLVHLSLTVCLVREIPSLKNEDDVPRELTLIGSFDNTIYWQDSTMRTQNEARSFCLLSGMELATFANKAHFDFIFSQAALDGSWTAYMGEYTRELYKWGNGAPIAQDIEITHYGQIGLRLLRGATNYLVGGQSSLRHPTICLAHTPHQNRNTTLTPETTRSIPLERKINNSKEFGLIGSFEQYTYWQDSETRTQSGCRTFCADLGLILVRFPNKAHLDFNIFQGCLDDSWTDGITFYTRNFYKTEGGGTIAEDIPIIHHVNLGLKVDVVSHKLRADVANFGGHCICALHLGS